MPKFKSSEDIKFDCGSQKTIELVQPVYKDINLGGAVLATKTNQQPARDEYKDNTGTDIGVETYALEIGDNLQGSFEIQHDYKEGTDLYFHIHWQGIIAPTGTDYVRFKLYYAFLRYGSVLTSNIPIETECAFDTQYKGCRADFTAITGTNIKIGDQMLFNIERITATGDAYAGDVLVATCGVHYQIDTLGSRQIGLK